MFICDKNKFIFSHIRKTGGTSIRVILENHYGVSYDEVTKQYFKLYQIELEYFDYWHSTLSTVLSFSAEKKNELLSQYTKWCFLRNPYTWAYSSWMEHSAQCQHQCSYAIFLDAGFNEYLVHCKANDWGWDINGQSPYMFYDDKFIMDFVGCFENYENDLQRILKICNVSYMPIHWNDKGDNNYLKHYNRNSIRIVNEYNKDIFETFGYTMLDPNLFPEEVDSENPLQLEYDDKPKYLKDGKIIPH